MKRDMHSTSTVGLVMFALFAAGCSKAQDTGVNRSAGVAKTKGKIGMTCMDLTNPFFKLIADVMTEEAAKHGYELVAQDGGNDAAKQNSQLTDFVAQKYDAIFLNPAESRAAGQGVKKAHAAGIPVFGFDVEVNDPEAKDLVAYYIGSDNYQGGRLAGESMMTVTGDRGNIAIITFPEITSCIDRRNGFVEHLKEHTSGLEIVAELSGRGNIVDGNKVATDLLQSHSDLVGIFAVNDPSALGAYAAIEKAGRQRQIHLIGFDASPSGKKAVFEKKLYDSPQQFPRKMATGTVAAFMRYLAGEELPKREFIPCQHYRYEDSLSDESRIAERW
jgi:ribose transport system substrate-binding protein